MITIDNIKQAAARLDGVAIKTPLLNSAVLDERVGCSVHIKPECLQHIGAFKFRGAYNRLSQLDGEERKHGVVAFSSGNHAQGVAYAAKLLSMPATIVMPSDAPKIKLDGTERLGAEIRLYDRHNESREDIAAEIATNTGATLVPAFDDWDIIAGQGTVGLELAQQLADKNLAPDAVLSPCGGGGLLAGVSTAIDAETDNCSVYGVEPDQFDDHFLSKRAGSRVKIDGTSPTLCDALMATAPGELTWSVNSRLVEDYLLVSEDDVRHAVSFAFRYLKLVVEPGGAVALAALLQQKLPMMQEDSSESSLETIGLVLSGGNIDAATLTACLEQFPNP